MDINHRFPAGPLQRIRDIIRQSCKEMGVHIVRGALACDHVHMFLSIPPRLSLSSGSKGAHRVGYRWNFPNCTSVTGAGGFGHAATFRLRREIGHRLMISAASASRLAQKLKRGLRLTPAQNPRNTGHGRLASYHSFLIELIHQDPDITLMELQGALADAHDATASVSGIDQALKRLGYTYKKNLIADERKRARAEWFTYRVPAISAMPERVVFLDETSAKTNLISLRGTRLTASAPFGSWGTQTLIAGLGTSDLFVPWVIKGAMDGPAFVTYIRDVLIPKIKPGTAIRRGIDPPDQFLILLIPRQLGHPSQQRSRSALARSRMLVSIFTALQS